MALSKSSKISVDKALIHADTYGKYYHDPADNYAGILAAEVRWLRDKIRLTVTPAESSTGDDDA